MFPEGSGISILVCPWAHLLCLHAEDTPFGSVIPVESSPSSIPVNYHVLTGGRSTKRDFEHNLLVSISHAKPAMDLDLAIFSGNEHCLCGAWGTSSLCVYFPSKYLPPNVLAGIGGLQCGNTSLNESILEGIRTITGNSEATATNNK
jgi:hypothetical protein